MIGVTIPAMKLFIKKRKNALLFTTFILVCLLCACGKKTEETEETAVTYAEPGIANSGATSKERKDTEDYTFEYIAELNGLEPNDLNALSGYNGGLVFLGHKYGDELVTNEDEALDSLKHVKTLAKLDGVELKYNRTDISPVTGNVVYTFYQTTSSEVDGEVVTSKFYNSLVKVITDADGNLLGLSADVIPKGKIETIDESEIITKEDAFEYVKELIDNPNRKIYEDATEYAFWDDEGTVLKVNGEGKISPAWFVYVDAEPDNKAGKPYEVFGISVSPKYLIDDDGDEFTSPAVIADFYVETLNFDDVVDVYTSELYFNGMKDVGDYTYEINLDWVKKYNPEYDGPAKASYTVPVMYSEIDDLYYLGCVSKKITLSNYYDFIMLDTTNAYVTDNPDDKNSWHFQLDKAEDGSSGNYFNNPDYVLSSFSVMCDVWDDYYERYGLDSVDGTGLPTVLLAYSIDGYEYPDNESDFEFNAINLGQNRDWQVMSTSIIYPGCLEHEVMSHEYTHGINGQLTMSQYFNSAGAVMESYADIIGVQMSILNDYPECIDGNEWHMGGSFGKYIRNMGAPEEFYMPKYPGGTYYLWPVTEVIRGDYDYGGVHTNSSILNYLTYCMVNGTGEADESTFTMEECLDVWFDTLYYTNYQSDYYDVACYLQLAARSMGLSDDKISYLRALLYNFGLIPDEDYNFTVAYEEDCDVYSINLEYDDTVYDNLAEAFKFGVTFFDKDENYYDAGGVSEDGSLIYAVEKGMSFDYAKYAIGDMRTYDTWFYSLDYQENFPHDIDMFFTVSEAAVGDTYTIDSTYEVSYVNSYDGAEWELLETEDEAIDLNVVSGGTIVVTCKDLEASTDDYGKYTVFMIICE